MVMARRKLALLTALALTRPAAVFLQASPEADPDDAETARAPVAATGLSIEHLPLTCLEESLFPEVRAAIRSAALVQNGRVYFKAHPYPDWYYVEMKADPVPGHLGTLPRPRPGTHEVDYYLYALDSRLQAAQSAEYHAEVASTCFRGGAERFGKAAEPWITLYGTREGQAPIPRGFDKAGIMAFVAVTGAVVPVAALPLGVGSPDEHRKTAEHVADDEFFPWRPRSALGVVKHLAGSARGLIQDHASSEGGIAWPDVCWR